MAIEGPRMLLRMVVIRSAAAMAVGVCRGCILPFYPPFLASFPALSLPPSRWRCSLCY
ncbi:hypothetical protein L211DRAFT_838144 [Terfezia boudieri ATCC MYA-4762]|uniref:Uncharacterized protein n=1 Tax=Terfezia boudieri ATCC MYA-4762 TaxID=1051890 RepID=A0A3N4LLB1_9PEZI|nr:hypothetical protein L211DRAFT_838144 [Terfezia boudieri ATCC MYA-4762]